MANVMKIKPFDDAQGEVVGFTSGKETDKGSKLRGLIGNVILDYKGKRLELCGFTNEERAFSTEESTKIAYQTPGEQMPTDTQGKHFKIGDTVEFRYRELSDGGIPKDARYYRGV
jgi:ATP-dependent DNA ligase